MSERAIKCAKWAKIKYLTNIIIPLKSFGSLGSLVFSLKCTSRCSAQDRTVLESLANFGNRWGEIAKLLAGR